MAGRSVPFFDHNPNSFVRIYTINEKEHTVALWKSFPCAKSKIRSNGILCYEQNRLFAYLVQYQMAYLHFLMPLHISFFVHFLFLKSSVCNEWIFRTYDGWMQWNDK